MKDLLNEKEEDLINSLAKLELIASHSYLYLSNCMKNTGFFGAAKFFLSESQSEIDHYNIWGEFLNALGIEIEMPSIDEIDLEPGDLLGAIKIALEMEEELLDKYEKSCEEKVSMKVKLKIYEFVNRQVEAVGEYNDLLARIQLTNEQLFIDQELGK